MAQREAPGPPTLGRGPEPLPPQPLCACVVGDSIPGGWASAAAMRRAEFGTSHAVVLTSLGPLGKRKSRAEVLVFAGTHVTRKPGSYKELGCNTTFGSCYAWCWRRVPSLRLLRNENSFLSHVQNRPRLGSVPQGPGRLGRKAEAEGAMGGAGGGAAKVS